MDQTEMNGPTEIPVQGEEKFLPNHKRLAPAVFAHLAANPGEAVVSAIVPHQFDITLSDGSRQRVRFTKGSYAIPKRFANHFYVKANGVEIVDGNAQAPKPQIEAPAPGAAETAQTGDAANTGNASPKPDVLWPADDNLEAMSFEQLGVVFEEHKLDASGLNSKAKRFAAIREARDAPPANTGNAGDATKT